MSGCRDAQREVYYDDICSPVKRGTEPRDGSEGVSSECAGWEVRIRLWNDAKRETGEGQVVKDD